MIYNRDKIVIPELCPIQFTEPVESAYYRMQYDFTPIVVGGTKVIFFTENDNVYELKLVDENGLVLYSIAGEPTELSDGYFYIVFEVSEILFENKVAQFVILDEDDVVLAESVWYIVNPDDTSLVKRIEYNHSENDYNMIFTEDEPFAIDLVCGFKPQDARVEEETEDFLEQNMVNETIDGDQYLVTPITFDNIPAWMAVKLARVFKCDFVEISTLELDEDYNVNLTTLGEYKRVNGSKIEKVEDTYKGLANYKIDIQKNENYIQ